jgi:hypothetical protein
MGTKQDLIRACVFLKKTPAGYFSPGLSCARAQPCQLPSHQQAVDDISWKTASPRRRKRENERARASRSAAEIFAAAGGRR